MRKTTIKMTDREEEIKRLKRVVALNNSLSINFNGSVYRFLLFAFRKYNMAHPDESRLSMMDLNCEFEIIEHVKKIKFKKKWDSEYVTKKI